MIKIKTYKGTKNVVRAAQLCLTNRLFVNRWYMRDVYYTTIGMPSKVEPASPAVKIVIAFDDDKPIAAATIDGGGFGCFFVRKKYRRKGIGTMLYKELLPSCTGDGIIGSDKFFEEMDHAIQ
jgi:GNAT superfamily N-acetyltransferase